MAKVSCSVFNCDYNAGGGCRLGSLTVRGAKADTSFETRCAAFSDRSEAGLVNCVPSENAVENCDVMCSAKSCRHNEDKRCTADRIRVGLADSFYGDETECTSFHKR